MGPKVRKKGKVRTESHGECPDRRRGISRLINVVRVRPPFLWCCFMGIIVYNKNKRSWVLYERNVGKKVGQVARGIFFFPLCK